MLFHRLQFLIIKVSRSANESVGHPGNQSKVVFERVKTSTLLSSSACMLSVCLYGCMRLPQFSGLHA